MIKLIKHNPYRTLGVLSNTPLKERIANQNKLNAFAKIGKSVIFQNDFDKIIEEIPLRAPENIAAAINAINLDRDQLKHSLFWFISASPIDGIALKYLQSKDIIKAKELFQKRESFSSLINLGVLAFIEGNFAEGYASISKVIHNESYRTDLLETLGLQNITLSENEIAAMFIADLLTEIPATKLLSAVNNPSDKTIISDKAVNEPIAEINAAISAAKSVNSKDANANLIAGTTLMNSTKTPLKQVRDIVGATSPKYQMVADNLAKQILQCGINYYNNAPDDDVESPRKAMPLQAYALQIAIGQLTKDRCQENYDILKKAVNNMPPVEVAVETRKVKEELRKFCTQPDKIAYSITLLNNTKSLLLTIKTRLGATNSFYLSLSTQVVGNALHNLIEEVNAAQNYFSAVVKAIKESGVDPGLLNYLGDEHSPAKIIDSKVKPVLREAWRAITIIDTFDMESDFRTNRYNVNRKYLKEMCDSLGISTYTSTARTSITPRTTPRPTTTKATTTSRPTSSSSSSSTKSQKEWYENGCLVAFIAWIVIGLIAGAICEANDGDFSAGFCISGFIVLLFSRIFSD